MSVQDGTDLLWDIKLNAVRYLLHEITHAEGVLETNDHTFQVTEGSIDWMPTREMYPVASDKGGPQELHDDGLYLAYGLESCLALTRRDVVHNTNKAFDNADSWSFYFLLRILVLTYPELDFMEAVREGDLWSYRNRHARKRSTLLHHCTLFQPLRHPGAGNIWDLPKYDPLKDGWGPSSGMGRPDTIEDLLDWLKALDMNHNGEP